VAERAIQIIENFIRVIFKDAGLSLEFWDKAAATDAYLKNRTDIGLLINRQKVTPEEAYSGTKPSIDYLRI
jgi:hypothetical protein